MNTRKLEYALGRALFMIGAIGTVVLFWEILAMNINYNFGSFRFQAIGYPWGTERVAYITDFWNMPSWTPTAPNVYFLNYAEVLVGAISLAVLGVFLSERSSPETIADTSHNKFFGHLFLIGTLLSLFLTLYAFVKIQVLQSVYLINNTLYVPHNINNLCPTPSAFFHFYNISLSIHRIAFGGGVSGTMKVLGTHITWDYLLFGSMGLTLIFMIAWKYFSPITGSDIDDTQDTNRRLIMDLRGPSDSDPELSIVIPTKNEVDNIERLISAVDSLNLSTEYIIVDDVSTDGTFSVLKNMVKERDDIVVIERLLERGISSALRTALPYCRGKYVALMDADFQHPPDALKGMLNIMKSTDTDLVIGTRSKSSYNSFGIFRRIVSNGAAFLARLFLPEVRGLGDPMSGFFMFRKGTVNEKDIGSNTFKVLLEIIVKARPKNIREYFYKFGQREKGDSKFNVHEMLRYISLLFRLSNYRLLKFFMVGLTGVVINELFLYILYSLTGLLVVSSAIAIELSILFNFMLNNAWTFKLRHENSLLQRLYRYNGVAIAGLVVNIGILIVLTHIGWPYLLANIIGIIFGFIINYTGSELLVWYKRNKK